MLIYTCAAALRPAQDACILAFAPPAEPGRGLPRPAGAKLTNNPSAMGAFHSARLQVEAGDVKDGIQRMQRGLDAIRTTGTVHGWSQHHANLVTAYLKGGQVEEGLSAAAEALASVDQTGERWFESELHRLRGELLRLHGDESGAEASFRRAIEVARQQQAKSWELRATMSLCRLWQQQGKRGEGRELLAELYGWFSEGFDSPDLQEAWTLLNH